MTHLDQPVFTLAHDVEDPADGIHGELVQVMAMSAPTALSTTLCDMRVARTRVESVRYPYPFRED